MPEKYKILLTDVSSVKVFLISFKPSFDLDGAVRPWVRFYPSPLAGTMQMNSRDSRPVFLKQWVSLSLMYT
jgi:hypothetical protein